MRVWTWVGLQFFGLPGCVPASFRVALHAVLRADESGCARTANRPAQAALRRLETAGTAGANPEPGRNRGGHARRSSLLLDSRLCFVANACRCAAASSSCSGAGRRRVPLVRARGIVGGLAHARRRSGPSPVLHPQPDQHRERGRAEGRVDATARATRNPTTARRSSATRSWWTACSTARRPR